MHKMNQSFGSICHSSDAELMNSGKVKDFLTRKMKMVKRWQRCKENCLWFVFFRLHETSCARSTLSFIGWTASWRTFWTSFARDKRFSTHNYVMAVRRTWRHLSFHSACGWFFNIFMAIKKIGHRIKRQVKHEWMNKLMLRKSAGAASSSATSKWIFVFIRLKENWDKMQFAFTWTTTM